MRKRIFRYFGGLLKRQEQWLNEMAAKGYRLAGTTRFFYDFEPCEPSEYEYRVEFAAGMAYQDRLEYREFLHSLGYRTFWKNVSLNISFGKAKFRPWANGTGKLAVSPGSYGKELLILEKKRDGRPFELHTDTADKIDYYRTLRSAWLTAGTAGLLLLLAVVLGWLPRSVYTIFGGAVLFVLGIVPALNYHFTLTDLKQENRIHE